MALSAVIGVAVCSGIVGGRRSGVGDLHFSAPG
jgi:hypothetical protein